MEKPWSHYGKPSGKSPALSHAEIETLKEAVEIADDFLNGSLCKDPDCEVCADRRAAVPCVHRALEIIERLELAE